MAEARWASGAAQAMGRFSEIDAAMAARLAAGEAMECVGRLVEAEPEEAGRVLAEIDLERYAALLEDADRSVARRGGADMRSELAMRTRALREQSARLERRAEQSRREYEAGELERQAARSLSGLADCAEEAVARWTRRGRSSTPRLKPGA